MGGGAAGVDQAAAGPGVQGRVPRVAEEPSLTKEIFYYYYFGKNFAGLSNLDKCIV